VKKLKKVIFGVKYLILRSKQEALIDLPEQIVKFSKIDEKISDLIKEIRIRIQRVTMNVKDSKDLIKIELELIREGNLKEFPLSKVPLSLEYDEKKLKIKKNPMTDENGRCNIIIKESKLKNDEKATIKFGIKISNLERLYKNPISYKWLEDLSNKEIYINLTVSHKQFKFEVSDKIEKKNE